MRLTFRQVREAQPCRISYCELLKRFGNGSSTDLDKTFLLEDILKYMDEDDALWGLDNAVPNWQVTYVNLLVYEQVKHFLLPHLNGKQKTFLNKLIALLWGVVYRKGSLSMLNRRELCESYKENIFYPLEKINVFKKKGSRMDYNRYHNLPLQSMLRFIKYVCVLDGEAVETLSNLNRDWEDILYNILIKID